MSQNRSTKTPKDIERKAIDPSGCLCTFYDGHHDRVLKKDHISVRGQFLESKKLPYCAVEKGSVNANFNLLQFIGLQDELRLNLLLDETKRIGIASVMNYSRRIDEYTRFFYYSWTTRQEQLADSAEEVQKLTGSLDTQSDATHVITAINFGIDLVTVLQLPSEAGITIEIDGILQKIRHELSSGNDNFSLLTPEEKKLLEKIINVVVYSNTPSLISRTNLLDMLYQIEQIKKKIDHCHPATYYLRPTKLLSRQYIPNNAELNALPQELIEQIERYLLRFRIPIKYVEASLKDYMPKLLYGYLQDRIYNARQQLSILQSKYKREKKWFSDLINTVRSGQRDVSTIHQALHENERNTLLNSIDPLAQNVDDLEKKGQWIIQSHQQKFENCNVAERHLGDNDITRTIELMIRRDDRRDEAFYNNDTLKQNNHSKLNDFDQLFVDEGRNNPNSHLIFAAGSSPSFQLQNTTASSPPPSKIDYDTEQSQQRILSPTDIPPTSVPPIPSSSTTDQIINILLLGETGVGKSTFINAFVNYLSFDTLQQAQSNKPVVLIPVSFLMTVGDTFEERIVKFGDFDNSKNEDFHHPGQSVTQHCKSYAFDLNDTNEKKLRIIDTPGFGDTRGLDQDDHNMQHILEYINNLTHLNAICILLKPNASRLNIFFRSCLIQLFSLLNPKVCNNIVFCFTNARATFYSPGDTAPLLKAMLSSLSIADIPFRKDNTFCFDSESFRYLVALQNKIPFSDANKYEYEMSWSKSVEESNRLINYIRTKLTVYRMQDGWQSIKHAQFEIVHMIRPILEAIRNIFRNCILWNIESSSKSIELSPTVTHRSAFLCLSCKQEAIHVGDFWITKDYPHEFENTCLICSCTSDQHIAIDYILNYKSMNNSSSYRQNGMNDALDRLFHASAEFAYFLIYIAHSTKEDPFGIGLVQMIIQENDLCDHQKPNHLNSQLAKQLREFQRRYEEKMNGMKLNQTHISLSDIYNLINTIREYPIVREQMAAVRQGQEIKFKQHECEYQEI